MARQISRVVRRFETLGRKVVAYFRIRLGGMQPSAAEATLLIKSSLHLLSLPAPLSPSDDSRRRYCCIAGRN